MVRMSVLRSRVDRVVMEGRLIVHRVCGIHDELMCSDTTSVIASFPDGSTRNQIRLPVAGITVRFPAWSSRSDILGNSRYV